MNRKKEINRNFAVFLGVSIFIIVIGLIFIVMASSRSRYDIINYVNRTMMLTGEILLGVGIVAGAGSIFYRYVSISKLEGKPIFAPVKEEDPVDALRKLKTLYEEKTITKEEYDNQKKKILERM